VGTLISLQTPLSTPVVHEQFDKLKKPGFAAQKIDEQSSSEVQKSHHAVAMPHFGPDFTTHLCQGFCTGTEGGPDDRLRQWSLLNDEI
jgi:hypothetical protein